MHFEEKLWLLGLWFTSGKLVWNIQIKFLEINSIRLETHEKKEMKMRRKFDRLPIHLGMTDVTCMKCFDQQVTQHNRNVRAPFGMTSQVNGKETRGQISRSWSVRRNKIHGNRRNFKVGWIKIYHNSHPSIPLFTKFNIKINNHLQFYLSIELSICVCIYSRTHMYIYIYAYNGQST